MPVVKSKKKTKVKTREHVNFYENIKEARMRLRNTVVLYDGEPYYIFHITDKYPNKPSIFRVYMEPIKKQMEHRNYRWNPDFGGEEDFNEKLDAKVKEGVFVRKMMSSAKFNKFRPFPLGMININGSVLYAERQPTRRSSQGLCSDALKTSVVTKAMTPRRGSIFHVGLESVELAETIRGDYPSLKECIERLGDKNVINGGVAFDREFALVRGPVDLLLLNYKTETIGYIDQNSPITALNLSERYSYLKEKIAEQGGIEQIRIK